MCIILGRSIASSPVPDLTPCGGHIPFAARHKSPACSAQLGTLCHYHIHTRSVPKLSNVRQQFSTRSVCSLPPRNCQLNSTSSNGRRCEHLYVRISITLIYIYVSDITFRISTHAQRVVKCGIDAVTWCDVTANHRRAAHSIPHFTFRIPHAAVPHFTHSLPTSYLTNAKNIVKVLINFFDKIEQFQIFAVPTDYVSH